MVKRLKAAVVGLSVAMVLLPAGSVCAPQKKAKDQAPTPAPIPAQILAEKKVFIANGGGDESGYEAATYSGGPDRAYNEFYAVMKAWGRYELVASPGEGGNRYIQHVSDIERYRAVAGTAVLREHRDRFDVVEHVA